MSNHPTTLTHRPLAALGAVVTECVPGFAGDWKSALKAILRRQAVVAWAEFDVLSGSSQKDLPAIVAEAERLADAAAVCRSQIEQRSTT